MTPTRKDKRKTRVERVLPPEPPDRKESTTLGAHHGSVDRGHQVVHVKFDWTEEDVAAIKAMVAQYRLVQMLVKELQAQAEAEREPAGFLEPEEEVEWEDDPDNAELRTRLVIRKAEASQLQLELKAAHYTKLRATLRKIDEAWENEDNHVMQSAYNKYEKTLTEAEQQKRSMNSIDVWELTEAFILKVLIPANWKFRGQPTLADFTTLIQDPAREVNARRTAKAVMQEFTEYESDDCYDDGQPESSAGKRFQLDPECEERIRRLRGHDRDPRLASDDDGTVTETPHDRRRKEVDRTGRYYH